MHMISVNVRKCAWFGLVIPLLICPSTTQGFSWTAAPTRPVLRMGSNNHGSLDNRQQRSFDQFRARNGSDNENDETWVSDDSNGDIKNADTVKRRELIYNTIALGLIGVSGVASLSLFQTNVYTPDGFTRLPNTQFIAALGDPKASQGSNAREWGLWSLDPGPRGVWLRDYSSELAKGDRRAPAGWVFNPNDWWLEEHGLIMEQPYFPLPAGRYLVTGGRLVTTGLTIMEDGSWKLDEGTLYDVTHLPCRSARYTPLEKASTTDLVGSPLTANPKDFPVAPGAPMPSVPGCNKLDYAVLFVVGKETRKSFA